MLYHLPIEPYETRYTADWIQQFENEFDKAGVPYKTILGTMLTSKINEGSVLDACGTNIFKLSQLQSMIQLINDGKVKDNDIIFFSDLWFPGIESLFYIRNITGIQFKVVGILHAGTYDPADFTCRTGMRNWGEYLEACWFEEFDMIFSATHFHKTLIINNSIINPALADKIKITGIPFYAKELATSYDTSKKENIVVFPHRVDKEKHPEIFDEFSQLDCSKDYKFIKTIEETKSRQEYFELLGKSKIMLSFADQETFGYSTVEAMALGNVVIVPDKLSYRETVPGEYRYRNISEAVELYRRAVSGELKPNYPELNKWRYSIPNMLNELKQGGYNV